MPTTCFARSGDSTQMGTRYPAPATKACALWSAWRLALGQRIISFGALSQWHCSGICFPTPRLLSRHIYSCVVNDCWIGRTCLFGARRRCVPTAHGHSRHSLCDPGTLSCSITRKPDTCYVLSTDHVLIDSVDSRNSICGV